MDGGGVMELYVETSTDSVVTPICTIYIRQTIYHYLSIIIIRLLRLSSGVSEPLCENE